MDLCLNHLIWVNFVSTGKRKTPIMACNNMVYIIII